MNRRFTLVIVTLFLSAGCASSSAQEATAAGASAGSAAPDVSGTYAFVLEASDVARSIRESCAGDDACWQRIAQQAAKEKIRFARDASGALIWSSFEVDGAEEHLFLEAPVELAKVSSKHVVVRIVASAVGAQAERVAKLPSAIDLEIVDAKTIAMTDSKKGRLVYTKE
jgi:hypothetical protein